MLDSGVVLEDDDLYSNVEYLSYGRDRHGIWFHEQMFGRATRLKRIDAATFVSFRNGYGADASTVYLGKLKLPQSDPASWTYLGKGYSMDHARVWFRNRRIKGIVREAFVVVNLPGSISLATDGSRYFENDVTVDRHQFQQRVTKRITACKSQAGWLARLS